MSSVWMVVLLVAPATVVIKASGPVILGGRRIPHVVLALLTLLAPALLAALVVTNVIGADRRIVFDARLAGVAAAALALALRAPLLVGVVAAAVVTALIRALH